jgi:hypothetical protein
VVRTEEEKSRAEYLVRQVAGVRNVYNNLRRKERGKQMNDAMESQQPHVEAIKGATGQVVVLTDNRRNIARPGGRNLDRMKL